MKALVYGSAVAVCRVEPVLTGDGFEVVAVSGEMIDRETSGWLYKMRDLDLVVLDATEAGAELLCRHFSQLGHPPLIILVDSKQANWGKLSCHGAVAFIAHEAGQGEFITRLQSAIRCCCKPTSLRLPFTLSSVKTRGDKFTK